MPTALGAVQGAYASGASSINDAGQVVGNVYLNDAYTEEVAVIWNNGATSRNPQWAKVRGRRFRRRMETQNQARRQSGGVLRLLSVARIRVASKALQRRPAQG